MRGSRAIAGAACLAWASAAAAAQEAHGPTAAPDEFLGGVVAESRILYPLQVGSWMAESEHRYPDQRLGVSVRYVDNLKQRWIDLYFYPAGPQVAQMLAAVSASERESIGLAARAEARTAEFGDLAPLTLGGPGADAAGVPAAAWGGERKCIIGSPTPKYIKPMPMPAANSIANQEVKLNSGRASSGPRRMRP